MGGVTILDRLTAKNIFDVADKEINEKGYTSIPTYNLVKMAVVGTEVNPIDYFYMDQGKLIFNSGRWKYLFLGDVNGE